jgi:hypothetical protein
VSSISSLSDYLSFFLFASASASNPLDARIRTIITLAGSLPCVSLLLSALVSIPWKETAYPGGAGSDHMSWTKFGYSSCQAFEGVFENHDPSE